MAPKRKPVPSHAFDTGSMSNVSTSGLESARSMSGKGGSSNDTGALALQESSSRIDAIPDISLPEKHTSTLDFERELIAALRLDTDSQSEQLVRLNGFRSRPGSQRTSVHSTGLSVLDSAQDSDSRTINEITPEENIQQSHVSRASSYSSVTTPKIPPQGPVVKIQEASVEPEPHLTAPHSENEPRRPLESDYDEKSQFHEDEDQEELCPSRSLSYASNVALSRSVSYASNVTVVLASKAVRTDQIRVLINGLPATTEKGKVPALDDQALEGQKQRVPVREDATEGLDIESQEGSREGPGDDSATLESTNSMERLDEVSPGELNSNTGGSNGSPRTSSSQDHHPGLQKDQLHHIPSVSSLDSRETIQTPLHRSHLGSGIGK